MGSSDMGPFRSLLPRFLLVLLCFILPLSDALRFDLTANTHSGKHERCVRNFVNKDQLVVVTAIVSGTKGDGQVVNMHVCGFC